MNWTVIKMNKAGIIPNLTRENAKDITIKVIEQLQKLNIEYILPKDICIEMNMDESTDDIYNKADFIIAIGGDGSFIHTAKNAAEVNKPVLCINAGNIAFLAGLEANELSKLSNLFMGEYNIEKHMMLDCYIEKDGNSSLIGRCLNEIVVARSNEISLVDLDAYCDNRKINSYRCDGLIISTSTGSTAYTRSAGGPVIDPSLECIILTPICGVSSSDKSLVFRNDSIISILKSKNNKNICLSLDGEKSIEFADNTKLIVKKSTLHADLIKIKSDEFFDVLNSKLI